NDKNKKRYSTPTPAATTPGLPESTSDNYGNFGDLNNNEESTPQTTESPTPVKSNEEAPAASHDLSPTGDGWTKWY
ncbi:MAG TPA: hypothetical protein PKM70_02435, partial [Clostridia bacterium]|nr:hypothetical protein [Clostridia bacterium]